MLKIFSVFGDQLILVVVWVVSLFTDVVVVSAIRNVPKTYIMSFSEVIY